MIVRRLSSAQADFQSEFSKLVAVDASVDPEITRRAEAIVEDVRRRGDAAVLEYTARFDRLEAEKLEELILQGGKNKYRSEFMRLMRDTMLGTAAYLREKVNEVDPKIRLSSSISQEMWDVNGFDVIELAKTFAGDTEPFIRIAGAPYWNNNIIPKCCRFQTIQNIY